MKKVTDIINVIINFAKKVIDLIKKIWPSAKILIKTVASII